MKSWLLRQLILYWDLVGLLLTAILGIGIYHLAYFLASERLAMLPAAYATIRCTDSIWALVALLAAGGLALATTGARFDIAALPDGRRFSIYLLADYRDRPGRQWRLRATGVAFMVFAGGLMFLGMNCYVQVRDDALVIHRFFSVSEDVHPYSETTSIETGPEFVAPNGRVRHERTYTVRFRDRSHWSMRDLPGASGDEAEQLRIAEFVSRKSGVSISELPSLR